MIKYSLFGLFVIDFWMMTPLEIRVIQTLKIKKNFNIDLQKVNKRKK